MVRGDIYDPLFETKRSKGRVILYRLISVSLFAGVFSIWLYRFFYLFVSDEKSWKWVAWVAWVGLLGAELWFGLYWLCTQALRWNPVFRHPLKHKLSQRYENELPRVDIFVCTADPEVEPPMMVVNTVLSVMAYDYPPEKLSVYLSDDAASQITFFALLEASHFAKHWLPFCRTFHVDPTSPSAYLSTVFSSNNHHRSHQFVAIQKLYDDMQRRVEDAAKSGEVSEDVKSKHNGFSQWDTYSSRRDHDTILQIIRHRKDAENFRDADGCGMPDLVYLAREKRPHYPHHFKAGAMNSLLRVSSKISNSKIIMNVDCDMYSNNSQSLRDALCFFMNEENGHEIAFVQFPQNFENITKNDLYGSALLIAYDVEFHGADGYGGPLYIGTGCFHRRDILSGRKFSGEHNANEWKSEDDLFNKDVSLEELEEESKALASCTYEENTLWGTEIGLLYGCAVEDVITGLFIQRKGWKSVYYNPERKAFLGVAPTTLLQTLIQHKRWSEGQLQILLSKHSPAWYANGRISLGLQMGYCSYCLWAPNCLPTLYYSIVPSLCLLKGIPLFPQMSSPWFIPFAYVILGETTYSLIEFLSCGVLATLAMLNLFCFLGMLKNGFTSEGGFSRVCERLVLQVVLCGALVVINIPIYKGLFFREDNGRLPSSVAIRSTVMALSACVLFKAFH